MKQQFMFVHAISGCDTAFLPPLCEMQKALEVEVLRSYGDRDSLITFTEPRSTPEDIANVGERFLLKLYGAIRSTSLDKLRYILTLHQSVDHLCHQDSNLSHCRQLTQPPTFIHTVPILHCNNGLETICAQLIGVGNTGTGVQSHSLQISQ